MNACGVIRRLGSFDRDRVHQHLLRRVTRAARNRWIERLPMLCLLDNGRMVRLARPLDCRLSFEEGQIKATLELPWPTAWTLLEEGLEEGRRLVGYATCARLACLRRSFASSARLRRRIESGVTSTSSSSAM